METTFFILFSVCLLMHGIRTAYSILKYNKRINPKNKAVFGFMLVVMFGLWISWFQMCELDPVQLNIPAALQYFGLSLFIAGLLLFIIPLIQLRGLENIDRLITGGIFSVIRHPMYLGMIFWVTGYPLFLKTQWTLISSLLWIGNILIWQYYEEKELLTIYPEFVAYKQKTWF